MISGNDWEGVHLEDTGTAGNVVEGDYIGANKSGSAAVGNPETAWGSTPAPPHHRRLDQHAGNVISGNNSNGVYIVDSGTSGNVVDGDVIGLNALKTLSVPNTDTGVYIASGASDNMIGGTSSRAPVT